MFKSNAEVKVGVMVTVALALLVAMIIFFSDFHGVRRGYEIKTLFSFTGGVQQGAPVRVAGVEVGYVKGISMKDEQVEVLLWVDSSVIIREGARPYVNSLGLVGEKYIEIVPGPITASKLKGGATLMGVDPVRIEAILRDGKDIADKLEKAIELVNEVFGTEEMRSTFVDTLSNARASVKNFKEFTQVLSEVSKEHRGDITTLVKNMKDVSESLRESVDGVNKLVKDTDAVLVSNKEDIRSIVKNLEEASEKLKIFAKEVEENPTILLKGKRKRSPKPKRR